MAGQRFVQGTASLKAQQLKKKTHLPMQEMQVLSLSQEDSLEKDMATHSSILARKTPWTEALGRTTAHGVTKSWA